jgi:hypothetical protein
VRRFLRRIVTGAMAIVAASTAGVVMHATPAAESSQHIELVANTTRSITITSDVRIRPAPNTSQQWLTTMPAGSAPMYICYVDGQNVRGTTKWFRIAWNGIKGYYSSVADDVPLALQNNIEGNYGIPRCGTGTDINQGSGSNATVTVIPEQRVVEPYNRGAAVQWALNNAQAIRGNMFADCTWFVSQALWAGGLHQTSWWNSYASRQGAVLSQPGTDIARGAPNLVRYLQERFPITATPLNKDRFIRNDVPEAQPGDIIAYDWNWRENSPDNVIDHLAIVVSIAPGNYPEVSEWGTQAVWEPYAKRGWTWSELRHKWLQEDSPDVHATLLHFNLPG